MRRRISRAQQTKNWCVGLPFPPPAYAGIHPTLYLFGFRANALNSPYLPGFDPGSGLERFEGPEKGGGGNLGASGPPGPPPGACGSGACANLRARASEPFVVRILGLVMGFTFFWPDRS